jgi:hypothetical protein
MSLFVVDGDDDIFDDESPTPTDASSPPREEVCNGNGASSNGARNVSKLLPLVLLFDRPLRK